MELSERQQEKRVEEVGKPSEDRIVMLSDGIFAIAITLLVLSIQIPLPDNSHDQQAFINILKGGFFKEAQYYIITFGVLAAYWINHRSLMNILKRINHLFLLLNLIFLAFVAFFPVVSTLLKYTQFPVAVIVYTAVLAGCGYSSLLLWIYAFKSHLITVNERGVDIKASDLLNTSLAPTFFLLSLLLLLLPPFQPDYVSYSWLNLPNFSPGDIFYIWLLLPAIGTVMRRLEFSREVRENSTM